MGQLGRRVGALEAAAVEARLREEARALAAEFDLPFEEVLAEARRWAEVARHHPPRRLPDGGWDHEPTIRAYYERQGLRGEALYRAVLAYCAGAAEGLPGLAVEIRREEYVGGAEAGA